MTGAYPVLHLGPVRSTRSWARTYRGTPASVPEARRFVGELLAGCPARETLMTCVSEFCANAIVHTASGRGGVFTVEVDRPRDGVARVAVTDDGGASVPAAGSLDLMADGGRGLAMVAACTNRWGFYRRLPGPHRLGRSLLAGCRAVSRSPEEDHPPGASGLASRLCSLAAPRRGPLAAPRLCAASRLCPLAAPRRARRPGRITAYPEFLVTARPARSFLRAK